MTLGEYHMANKFKWDNRATALTVAAGMLFVAGLMASITAGVAFAEGDINDGPDSDGGPVAEFHMWELEVSSFGFGSIGIDYTDKQMDEADGVDLLRAAGPLMVVGIVFAWLAFVGLVAGIFFRHTAVRALGPSLAGTAFLFLVLGLILFSVGVDQFADWRPDGGEETVLEDLTYVAGFALTIVATTMALAGTFTSVFAPVGAVKGKTAKGGKAKASRKAPGAISFD